MTQTLTTEQLRAHAESLGLDFFIERRAGIWVKEWLNDGCTSATAEEVLLWSMLANREAQPVFCISEDELNAALQLHRLKSEGHSQLSDAFRAGFKYARRTAPPAPAVPEDYQHLKNVRELYHKQEDRLFSLAQLINGPSFDKYSQSVDQAISVLEREIFSDDGDTCRAAMLAAAPEGN